MGREGRESGDKRAITSRWRVSRVEEDKHGDPLLLQSFSTSVEMYKMHVHVHPIRNNNNNNKKLSNIGPKETHLMYEALVYHPRKDND